MSHVPLGKIIEPALTRRAGEKNFPVLSMTMRDGLVNQADKFKKRIASADTSAYKVVGRKQLVVGFPIDEGVLAFQNLYEEAIVSPAYNIWNLQDPAKANTKYLELFLRSPHALVFYKSKLRSTTARRRSLPNDEFLSLPVPLPPLAEQERIVKLLDEADELRKLRAQADTRSAQLLPALFHEMFGDPVRNPKGLPVVRIEEAGRVQLGRQRAPKYQTGKFTRPYVRVANVFEDRIDISDVLSMDFDERDYEQYRLQHGDILLNEGQSTELVGRPAMWRNEVPNCCFQNTLVRFQPDRDKVLPDFALVLFLVNFRNGDFAKVSSKTSNVAHLGAARFAKMPFLLPPMPLQKQFTDRVNEIRKLEAAQAASRQRTEDLFQSVLHKAFKGDL